MRACRAGRELDQTIPASDGAPAYITGLAKQLDKLARYERRALSLRERALGKLAEAIAGERLQHETEMPDRPEANSAWQNEAILTGRISVDLAERTQMGGQIEPVP